MKRSLEAVAKNLFGDGYGRLARALFLYLVVYWGLHITGFQNLFSIYQTVLECAIIAEQEGAEADEKKLSE